MHAIVFKRACMLQFEIWNKQLQNCSNCVKRRHNKCYIHNSTWIQQNIAWQLHQKKVWHVLLQTNNTINSQEHNISVFHMPCTTHLIEFKFQFKFNYTKMRYKLVHKIWKICSWLWYWILFFNSEKAFELCINCNINLKKHISIPSSLRINFNKF